MSSSLVPPERVWRALTDPVTLGEWLMPNDFEAAGLLRIVGGGWRGLLLVRLSNVPDAAVRS